MVGRPFWRAGGCRQALMEGREGSGGHTEGPAGFGRPSQRDGRGRETLLEGLEESGGPT